MWGQSTSSKESELAVCRILTGTYQEETVSGCVGEHLVHDSFDDGAVLHDMEHGQSGRVEVVRERLAK